MTGRKKKRAARLYEKLTARERVAMIFLRDCAGEDADLEIKSSMPSSQIQQFNHLLGALDSIYKVIGPTAVELRHRSKILQLLFVIAWTHIRWANDRRMLIVDSDEPSELPVPGNPMGVIPALTPEDRLIPDDELGSIDLITRYNLKSVQDQLPQCMREKVALEQVYEQLKSEIGAKDEDEPLIRELLDETANMLETLEGSARGLLSFADADLDSPEPHYLGLVEQAVDTVRKDYG